MPYIEMTGAIPSGLTPYDNYQVYNCLDSCITSQLLPVLRAELNPNTSVTYNREMRVLALCLEMSSKGFPVDQMALAGLIYDLDKAADRALLLLHRFCEAVGFRPVNPRSPKDVPELFYEHLRLPEIWEFDRKTNTRKLAADIKALEKLRTQYPIAAPFVNAIVSYRENTKMASVFKRGLEPGTGNLRCNYSPSGTETGRLSSQQNPYGRGTNGQNLTDRVRQVITAPEGYAILNFDLKTAESVAVGYISGDRAYIEACEGSDLHTAVCRLVWPHLPWAGDKSDKALAESPFYRHFSYRDQAKRGGHGSNYYGQPSTIAGIINVPTSFVESFQRQYFEAFPGIPEWHLDVIARVQREGVIVTPLRRERRFWGRPDDKATWREAIAYGPQSLVGDVMNEGLIQVMTWIKANMDNKTWKLNRQLADLRSQIHDAGVFLVPLEALEEVAPIIEQKLLFPVEFPGIGTMSIRSDMMVGKRFCKKPKGGKWKLHPVMSQGLADWEPGQPLHWKDAA
jgi:DNA polymerase I-like protein with 3'-5' exonuclease and polymerase domains